MAFSEDPGVNPHVDVSPCVHMHARLPPESPLLCIPAAAAACRCLELRCTRRTFCNPRPAGRVWPSADPGRVSRHQCQWKSHGWLNVTGGGWLKKRKVKNPSLYVYLVWKTVFRAI